jgi:hypothetical protein
MTTSAIALTGFPLTRWRRTDDLLPELRCERFAFRHLDSLPDALGVHSQGVNESGSTPVSDRAA